MMNADEEGILRSFKDSGSRDALRVLLITHQDRIYTVCLQVLGREQDAEDVTQEVLVKLANGARSARDADSFRGWIYRVSLRTALNAWNRRAAIRLRETRSAMERPAPTPLDDRERLALFEAMDGLDDPERSLLMEHYFEKVPLASLGDRRGVSAVAIWKRIDRAREKLKKLLLSAGFIAASARVGDALEATVPATAPSTLVGEALLGKILAGGIAMGATKSSVVPAVAVTLVLLFGLSTGGYLLLRSRSPMRAVQQGGNQVANKSDVSTPGPPPVVIPDSVDAVKPEPVPAKSRLLNQLERYKLWHEEWRALGRTLSSIPENSERVRLLDAKMKEASELLEGTRKLIFDDPQTFLDFLRDPAHEELCEMLIGQSLDNVRTIDGAHIVWPQKFEEFPRALAEGFLDLLRTGTPSQQAPLLRFLIQVEGVPKEFEHQYVALLRNPNPGVQTGAIAALTGHGVLRADLLEQVWQVYEASADAGVRATALSAISRTDTEEVQRWMVSRLVNSQDAQLVRPVAQAVRNSLMAKLGSTDEKTLERHTSALMAAAKVRTDESGYHDLVLAAVNLPADRAAAVLESALSNAPTPKYEAAVSKLLEKIRAGGTNWKTLMGDFQTLLSKN